MYMYTYNSRNRNEQPPLPHRQSSREAVPWGSFTLSLPNKVSSSPGPLERRHFFFSTLKTSMSANRSYAHKIGAFASRFETGEILLRDAHGQLAPMYDETSRQPIWDSPAIQISNPVKMNEDGNGVSTPSLMEKMQPASVRQLATSCAVLRFDLTIDPTTAPTENAWNPDSLSKQE